MGDAPPLLDWDSWPAPPLLWLWDGAPPAPPLLLSEALLLLPALFWLCDRTPPAWLWERPPPPL